MFIKQETYIENSIYIVFAKEHLEVRTY